MRAIKTDMKEKKEMRERERNKVKRKGITSETIGILLGDNCYSSIRNV
jgi:hypothetical protein